MIVGTRAFATLVLLALAADTTAGQNAPAPRDGQITVSGGMLAVAGYPIGTQTVTLPRNPTGTGGPFTLLATDSRLDRVLGVEARVAFVVTPPFSIEVGGAFSEPDLDVTVSQDAEAPDGATATSRVKQYGIDGSAIYHLPMALGRHARTYLLGGAGYIRQLHEGRLLVETGTTVHVGGGVQYWFSSRQARGLGARGELRYVRRQGGVDFEDRSRGYPTMSVLAFFGF